MNADTILAIPLTEPERLFSKPGAVKDEFRDLAKKWHPDFGGNGAVFDRIKKLRDAAEEKWARGEWHTPGLLEIFGPTKNYRVRYNKKHDTETGALYISRHIVTHATKSDFADLVHAGHKLMGAFPFASDGMRKEVQRYLPNTSPSHSFEAGGIKYTVMHKTPDLILLRDLLDHCGGKIDPKHVAWIISSLLNLACYFEYAGIVHNAIGPDTYFISPPMHSGALLGGWWYACKSGDRMAALPARTARLIPPDIINTKRAHARTDLALIRATGREILGDLDKAAPKPMAKWLRYPSSGSAVEDYKQWGKVLTESFGPRRFTEMKIKASDIYDRKD